MTVQSIRRMAEFLGLSITIDAEAAEPYGMPIVTCGDETVTCERVKGYWYWLRELARGGI